MAHATKELQAEFFRYAFGDRQGYLCISTASPGDKGSYKDHFFRWPGQLNDALNFIEQVSLTKHVWFGVNLLDKARRLTENVLPGNLVWADLDAQKPDTVDPSPSTVWQSSPGRYQALWRMSTMMPPEVAQDYSRRLAYLYKHVDVSGWDLTQVLRVPFTRNYKYGDGVDAPQVELLSAVEDLLPVQLFEVLPEVAGANGDGHKDEIPMPELDTLPDPNDIIKRYHIYLDSTDFMRLFQAEPDIDDDWSKLLWKLINICIEAGMESAETFCLAHHSSYNKYERDNRPPRYLWRDVLKAESLQQSFGILADGGAPFVLPKLYDEKEVKKLPKYWLDDYISWAEKATDAIGSYHSLAGTIALSSVVAAGVRLETSYGAYAPNLWGLILGESTWTRKSTAMTMITSLLGEIDDSIIMATDGSAEGLLTALSHRPHRVSVFYKDEVSGFFDSINRKDYLAGMPEILTHLYDVPKFYTRILRKETIKLSNPVFIFFGGGIKDRVATALSEDYVYSGFLPRFLVVSGEAEIDRIRPTGPPIAADNKKRDKLLAGLSDLYELYGKEREAKVAGQIIMVPPKVEAILTEEAWERYANIEMSMTKAAFDSPQKGLAGPTFERLARSLLKLALLLGAARQEPVKGKITIELMDILKASVLIQEWGQYSVELIQSCGIASTEHNLRKILRTIDSNPGIYKGLVMRWHHLGKRDADEIVGTLIERGQVRFEKVGKGVKLWTV